jgi:hypothetical protein
VAIDASRADYIFASQSVNLDIQTTTLDYGYFALITDSIGISDTGVPKYLGTLIVQASNSACGVFTIGLRSSESYIFDPSHFPTVVFPQLEPLVITVLPCIENSWTCVPHHCNIDARMPHDPFDLSQRLNANSLEMVFDRPMTNAAVDDFIATIVPHTGVLPAIAGLTIAGNSVTVELAQRIAPGYWTCITHLPTERHCCMGSLPADADWSRLVNPSDVDEVLDNLAGQVSPRLLLDRCDLDRSGRCAPADLLTAVDLLTGADLFATYSGATLPACPGWCP